MSECTTHVEYEFLHFIAIRLLHAQNKIVEKFKMDYINHTLHKQTLFSNLKRYRWVSILNWTSPERISSLFYRCLCSYEIIWKIQLCVKLYMNVVVVIIAGIAFSHPNMYAWWVGEPVRMRRCVVCEYRIAQLILYHGHGYPNVRMLDDGVMDLVVENCRIHKYLQY